MRFSFHSCSFFWVLIVEPRDGIGPPNNTYSASSPDRGKWRGHIVLIERTPAPINQKPTQFAPCRKTQLWFLIQLTLAWSEGQRLPLYCDTSQISVRLVRIVLDYIPAFINQAGSIVFAHFRLAALHNYLLTETSSVTPDILRLSHAF